MARFDHQVNLYDETINILSKYGKTEDDIRWIGNGVEYFDMTGISLKDIFDFEYDSGFGTIVIAADLLVVGDGWWLERREYDGSEWWEFKQIPEMPTMAAKEISVFEADRRWFK